MQPSAASTSLQSLSSASAENLCGAAERHLMEVTKSRMLLEDLEQKQTPYFRTMYNLGCHVYTKADVEDATRPVICLGKDIYMDLSRTEAIEHLKKVEIILKNKVDVLTAICSL